MAKSSCVFDKDLRGKTHKTQLCKQNEGRRLSVSWDDVLLCQRSNVLFDLSMTKYKANNNNLPQQGCKGD